MSLHLMNGWTLFIHKSLQPLNSGGTSGTTVRFIYYTKTKVQTDRITSQVLERVWGQYGGPHIYFGDVQLFLNLSADVGYKASPKKYSVMIMN